MVVIISFRKKKLKIGCSLVVIIILASFNLFFINYLDSSLKKNYISSITRVTTIGSDISEEKETGLQTKIINWSEILANNSNLSNLDNIISYPDSALVKVREDNKVEFIIKRDTKNISPEMMEFLSKYNVEIYEDVPYFNTSIIYASLETLGEFLSESDSTFGITYTEPNFYVQLDFVPDDECYESDQWDLSLIGIESAWEYELGSHDVKVAVVDTGIDYTHPDLTDNYLPLGYDWVNNDSDPRDDNFHGTHCAGTIAAVINNSIGVAGMANVSIFAEKAFNSYGSGSYLDCKFGLIHAVDMGADIISCSWGGVIPSQTLFEGIEYAINNGVMVIAAAGNSNSSSKFYPAAYAGVISVSATNKNDIKADFSNYGEWVDVSAPGVDILSTVPYNILGYYYGFASGTSMAAPHVSGLAALLMSAFPSKNTSQIEALIYESALDLGSPGFDPYYGHGRIDLSTIFGPDNSPPTYSNLIESANPLELGNTEVISIDVIDPSGIQQVLIEFEGSNHSMTNIGGNTWHYSSWTPLNVGTYTYIIFMEDNYNNLGSVSGSIQVIEKGNDITPPTYSNLIESADPLVLGNTEIISIDVIDPSGIQQVLIEFEGSNHSMNNIGGNTWQYSSWTPVNVGTYTYIIFMEDNYNNLGLISNSIQVIEDSDSTPPTYSNWRESADPLILGNIEIITIDITDPSGINQVLIQFEGDWYQMINIGGDSWQYDSWTPSELGVYIYVIYMEDHYYNSKSVSGSIKVIEGDSDYTPPTYSNWFESKDPLELGNTETIMIDVVDPSGIKQVLIQFEGINHSMINIGENTWKYNSWAPSNTGIYSYIIFMEDNHDNWNYFSDSILVIDTTPPSCRILTNESEPIELGNSTAILVKVTDSSGIKKVIFQYEGMDYNMRDIGGDVWQFKQFTPSNLGYCNYTIYVEDNNNNWKSISNSVEVIDTQAPDPPDLISFPSGNVSKQIIFDWEDGYDPSGITFYRLIIDNELNPFLTPGFIFEVNISNNGSESSFFVLKESLSLGTYYFFIYQIDSMGHQSSPATGKFIVISPNTKSLNQDNMVNIINFLVIIIVGSLAGTSAYVVVKKVKSEKKIQPLNKQFEMKNYNIYIKKQRDKRLDLESEAKKLVKIGNYEKASVLYEQCRNISNDLFKFGIVSEAEKAKYYSNKSSKAFQIQEQEISYIKTNINAFLTEYFNKLGINYYSNPEIYLENQNDDVNGMILNNAKFLYQILLNPKKGYKLTEELNFNSQTLTNFKAFQFLYTNDFSQQTISDYCVKYYNPEILLLIVNINNVTKLELELLDSLIQEKDIKYADCIRCISYESFSNILGLKGKNRNDFLKIFDFSKNFNSTSIIYHHTEELKEMLKQKKLYLFF